MPSGDPAVVRNIERDSSTCNVARAGDNVVASLHGVDQGQVIQGGVLCHPDFPVTIASSLELKILILDIATPIIIGSQVTQTYFIFSLFKLLLLLFFYILTT